MQSYDLNAYNVFVTRYWMHSFIGKNKKWKLHKYLRIVQNIPLIESGNDLQSSNLNTYKVVITK